MFGFKTKEEKKQTIYISTNDDSSNLSLCSYSRSEEWIFQENLKSIEAFVFTPEELKQLLENYTNKIIENVEVIEGFNTGFSGSAASIDKQSIISQLSEFLKEQGYE